MLSVSRRLITRRAPAIRGATAKWHRMASRLSQIQTDSLLDLQPQHQLSLPLSFKPVINPMFFNANGNGNDKGKDKIESNDNTSKDDADKKIPEKPKPKSPPPQPKSKDIPGSTNSSKSDNAVSDGKTDGASSSAATPPSNNGGSDDDNGNTPKPPKAKRIPSHANTLEIPEVYPEIIALPISRRPLFPGFYKAVIVSDINVIKALKESIDKKYPFIGCFLFKDETMESDIIEDKDQVFKTGVLAQITSHVYSKDKETGVETLTAVLYPHKRIQIDELFPPKEGDVLVEAEGTPQKKEIIEGISGEKEGDEPKPLDPTEILNEEQVQPIEEEEQSVTEFLKKYPITLANVSNIEDKEYDKNDPMVTSLTASILDVLKEMSSINKSFSDQLATFSASLHQDIYNSPEKLADFCAAIATGSQKDLQDLLECTSISERLTKALEVLKKEMMNKELQKQIEKDIEERMSKRHREYHLNEQLKWIKKELGIDDGRDKLIEKFNERVKDLTMPEEVQKVYNEEIAKLNTLETVMSEFTVTRNYLDWLTQVPWGKQSKDSYNIKRAKKILDDDHYGLKDVKDRIIEFVAVGKLLNKINGKIICFVGPPGVGKTSIGKSIANSLNREFYRFSVGGLSDVAEIKGHRRTYVGAIPGRIVQALKKTQTENPLILIDEIDKISHSHSANGGDPSAALLELLDPEQNYTFMDNYMDVPLDLSKVLFVCTANTLSTIPGPLLDRMEVIEISGYIEDEKIKIAEKYLAPEARKNAGLENVNVDLTEGAIKALIKNYCRESGVRNLKKQIDKIYRKAALNVVVEVGDEEIDELLEEEKQSVLPDGPIEDVATLVAKKEGNETASSESTTIEEEKKNEKSTEEVVEPPQIIVPESYSASITADNLKDFVGVPVFTSDRLYQTTPPGVVMGLAWTSMGGSALYIESVLEHAITKESHAKLERTGQLGDVMKESVRIAYSFAKMFLAKNFNENLFFDRAQIHLHCPEGATPKDGPSAGVTITSSFLSLALNRALPPDVAMTGEITLTGKVLRIGGLKEKAIAAKRSGVKTIIFPKDNESDWKELPDNVKEGLTPVPAEWYQDVFDILFKDVNTKEGNTVWKAEFDKIANEEKKDKEESKN